MKYPLRLELILLFFSFKRYLTRNQLKLPKYFQYGTRKEQILVARLRLNCSSLRQHLFSRNLVESNTCSCGQTAETTEHFLLYCPNYVQARNVTISTLGNIDVRSLLYGNGLKTDDDNFNMFQNVTRYIILTKRFEIQ